MAPRARRATPVPGSRPRHPGRHTRAQRSTGRAGNALWTADQLPPQRRRRQTAAAPVAPAATAAASPAALAPAVIPPGYAVMPGGMAQTLQLNLAPRPANLPPQTQNWQHTVENFVRTFHPGNFAPVYDAFLANWGIDMYPLIREVVTTYYPDAWPFWRPGWGPIPAVAGTMRVQCGNRPHPARVLQDHGPNHDSNLRFEWVIPPVPPYANRAPCPNNQRTRDHAGRRIPFDYCRKHSRRPTGGNPWPPRRWMCKSCIDGSWDMYGPHRQDSRVLVHCQPCSTTRRQWLARLNPNNPNAPPFRHRCRCDRITSSGGRAHSNIQCHDCQPDMRLLDAAFWRHRLRFAEQHPPRIPGTVIPQIGGGLTNLSPWVDPDDQQFRNRCSCGTLYAQMLQDYAALDALGIPGQMTEDVIWRRCMRCNGDVGKGPDEKLIPGQLNFKYCI